MCRFASFVLTKDGEFWSDTSDSHETIIAENSLHADGAHGPNILRVELAPPMDGDWRNWGKWAFRIDQDIAPEWHDRREDGPRDEGRSRDALARRFAKAFKVGWSLDLRGCPIKSLPEGLKVGGSLDLRGCPIKVLPEGLKVGGSLDLSGCPIKALPEGLKAKCYGWVPPCK
jgi:hypothetical protein